MDDLEKKLTQSDIPLKPGEFLAVRRSACAALASCFAGIDHTQHLHGDCSCLVWCWFIAHSGAENHARLGASTNSCCSWPSSSSSSPIRLRSGQTFLQGVEIASKESPNPIGMEFRLLLKETNLGIPVETAFANMLLRVPSEDLKIVMSAFSIQRNVGGNLADIMDQVAAMIRQRIQIQGQIKVLTTQGKLSGHDRRGLLPIAWARLFP